jgi:hypothetical protein
MVVLYMPGTLLDTSADCETQSVLKIPSRTKTLLLGVVDFIL